MAEKVALGGVGKIGECMIFVTWCGWRAPLIVVISINYDNLFVIYSHRNASELRGLDNNGLMGG